MRSKGAVYDHDGRLIPESQRRGGISGDHVVAVDPISVDVTGTKRLRGTWLYGGHWMTHFGHFITETLTTLWPEGLNFHGVIFHPFVHGSKLPGDVARELFRYACSSFEPVIIDAALQVEHLLVPTRPFTINAAATARAVDVWKRVAAAATQSRNSGHRPSRIFLSRTRLHEQYARKAGSGHKRALSNELDLDELFRKRKVTVFYPEQLSISEQINLARGAEVLCGVSGSALHLSAFSPPETRVLEIADVRSPRGLPNQRVIDSAVGHEVAVIAHAADQDRKNAVPAVNLEQVERALDDLLGRR
jgi:capsular polysaccharide biosynthesis protein